MNELQEKILKRNAVRLLPILTLAYLVNYLDRTNISFAALTMNKDIGLTATQYGRGAGIFFIAYCAFEVPSNLALYRFGARLWIARIMITWGLVSIGTVLVTGPWSFYIMRFLLGLAEAGFFAGVAFYLAAWFPAQYRARILAGFLVAIPFSTVVGAPLSGLLLQLDGALGLAGWKWLLIVEGLPAVALGVVVAFLLADRPETAGWLAPPEKAALTEMLAAEPRERVRAGVLESFRDSRVIVCALVQFGFTIGSYGMPYFIIFSPEMGISGPDLIGRPWVRGRVGGGQGSGAFRAAYGRQPPRLQVLQDATWLGTPGGLVGLCLLALET